MNERADVFAALYSAWDQVLAIANEDRIPLSRAAKIKAELDRIADLAATLPRTWEQPGEDHFFRPRQ